MMEKMQQGEAAGDAGEPDEYDEALTFMIKLSSARLGTREERQRWLTFFDQLDTALAQAEAGYIAQVALASDMFMLVAGGPNAERMWEIARQGLGPSPLPTGSWVFLNQDDDVKEIAF